MENRDDRIEKYKKNRNKKKKRKPFKIVLYILILFILAGVCWKLVDTYMPNFKQISVKQAYPEWIEGQISTAIEDSPIQTANPAVQENGEIYLPVEFVKSYIDKYIFWEDGSQKLTVTTENKVIKMKTDDLTAYVNNEKLELDLPIEFKNNTAYMPKTLIESLYSNIGINYNQNTQIVTVDYSDRQKSSASISSKKSVVRSGADIKSPIVDKLVHGDEIIVYSKDEKWTKIRTDEGVIGYIRTKDMSNISAIPVKQKEVVVQSEPWKPSNGKINLIWDLVTNVDSSVSSDRLRVEKGLDIMSPTWFEIADESGNIKNIANPIYVNWAHQNGYKVWALFGNKFDGHFDGEKTHDVLTNSDARENMIKQILALTAMYNLDGINIDFEELLPKDSEYYLQFIREITPLLKEQGVVVSVDVLVPKSFNKHYQRDELAKIVDYVIIMGYDEHWATSPESGSVASIGWVEQAIQDSLNQEDIPAEKLILAVPYYCRLWIEKPDGNGGIDLKSQVYGMDGIRNFIDKNGIVTVWDENSGQYYGEYQKDGATHKVWVEDEKSIEEKLKLVNKYNLAGVAGWQRMFTSDEVWNVLYRNLKQ